jgi:hypothetical protein
LTAFVVGAGLGVLDDHQGATLGIGHVALPSRCATEPAPASTRLLADGKLGLGLVGGSETVGYFLEHARRAQQ